MMQEEEKNNAKERMHQSYNQRTQRHRTSERTSSLGGWLSLQSTKQHRTRERTSSLGGWLSFAHAAEHQQVRPPVHATMVGSLPPRTLV